jgi:hypothetical protein
MYRLPTLAVRCLAACIPALGLLVAFGPAASASAVRAPSVGPVRGAAPALAARVALQQFLAGRHGFDHLVHVDLHGLGLSGQADAEGSSQSTNWSGYADTGGGFSAVSGSWTQPAADCSGFSTSVTSFWVGIDGTGSSTVEQDGTVAVCLFGTTHYFSWWEMDPTNVMQLVGYSVEPGDAITAAVTRSGTSYTLTLTDSTHPADSFSTTQTCSDCDNASAEWIAEAPTVLFGVTPLANFGTWDLNNATATAGSVSGAIPAFTGGAVTMVDSSGNVQAQPGALSSDGSAFTDTWLRGS